jgi:prepilin-type N-terminal cleavage/methylation domain-containing protein
MVKSPARTRRAHGFTLVELVAVLVILGSLVAIAFKSYAQLRYDARIAKLEALRMTVRANVGAARLAYLSQGLTPGAAGPFGPTGTVQVAGQSIEVNGEDVDVNGWLVPAGSPTARGMWTLLGCGTVPTSTGTTYRCPTLPGFDVSVIDQFQGLSFFIRGTSICYAAYRTSNLVRPAGSMFGTDEWFWDGQGTERRAYHGWENSPVGC